MSTQIDKMSVNAIRVLAADAVQNRLPAIDCKTVLRHQMPSKDHRIAAVQMLQPAATQAFRMEAVAAGA